MVAYCLSRTTLCFALLTAVVVVGTARAATVTGELKTWHKVTITFDGPSVSESETTFKDYRLDVTFTNGAASYKVPGYFAADGDAGESSATSGNKWRVHFAPDRTGTWSWEASFRTGSNIAASLDASAGSAVSSIDGQSGTFNVTATDKTGDDFRGKGKLVYVGDHYLQFQGTKGYFIKVGPDVPEVFLEYRYFDGTPSLRTYPAHTQHWNTGDPEWKDGQGHDIIGVVNYLASVGMNVHYFLTMNAYGDGKNAYPWTGKDNYYTYDCSKLDQWQIVFDHMQKKGIMCHFVLTEQENQSYFEEKENLSGGIAPSRKVYFREMVARFGYLNAITWNIGEENGWNKDGSSPYDRNCTTNQRKAFAEHMRKLTYYEDNICIHNGPDTDDGIFTGLLGDPNYTGIAHQGTWNRDDRGHNRLLKWITNSANAGRKWVVSYDEPYGLDHIPNSTERVTFRKFSTWGGLMAGAAGVEVWSKADLTLVDYTAYQGIWDDLRYAKEFFENHLPFWEMKCDDALTSTTSDYCLAKEGEVYAIYLKSGGTTNLDLTGYSGNFTVQWYNPRAGGTLIDDGTVTGGGNVQIGPPPSNTSSDWVALVTIEGGLSGVRAVISATPTTGEAPLAVSFDGTGSSGENLTYSWNFGDGATGTGSTVSHTYQNTGAYTATLTVSDGSVSRSSSIAITVIGLRNPDNPTGTSAGLHYDYYEGSWEVVPNFDNLTPVSSGTATSFDISSFSGDNFGVVFKGYIEVPEDAVYTFTTSSDDGSKLYIGDSLIVSNDGTHAPRDSSGSIALKAGKHAIRVDYFEALQGEALTVSWQGGSISSKTEIPGSVLSHSGSSVIRHPSLRAQSVLRTQKLRMYDIRGRFIGATTPDAARAISPLHPRGLTIVKDGDHFRKQVISPRK